MKNQINLFVIILFPLIIKCENNLIKKDSNTTVRIELNAIEYKNDTLGLRVPYQDKKIILDSNGIGSVFLDLEHATYIYIEYEKYKNVHLFLEPGKDVSIHLDSNELKFTGPGAPANDYLKQSNEISKMYNDSALFIRRREKRPSPEEFLEFHNFFNTKYEKLYDNFIQKTKLTTEEKYILKGEFLTYSLYMKQNMIRLFDKNVRDSSDLENKCGLNYIDHLYQDTILLKANCKSIKIVLNNNYNHIQSEAINYEELEKKPFPLEVFNLIQQSGFSKDVKEHWYLCTLNYSIHAYGYNDLLDSLNGYFVSLYPRSKYSYYINKTKKKLAHLSPGKLAPDFELTALDGEVYRLDDFKGKVIFIDVWATWCVPCKKGFPKIVKLIEKYKEEDIQFLFMTNDRNIGNWKKYIKEHPELKGKHLMARGTPFLEDYNITGIPRYLIIDKEGRFIDAFANRDRLEDSIEVGLNKNY